MSHTSTRHPLSLLIISLLFFIVGGCQQSSDLMSTLTPSAKKYDSVYLKQTLIPGKTTKNQVMQLFGAPSSNIANMNSNTAGNQYIWKYEKNEEGFDKYLQIAHKYVPVDTSLKMFEASTKVSQAQGVKDDVNTVTGTKSTDNKTTGSILTILFDNDIVTHYDLY